MRMRPSTRSRTTSTLLVVASVAVVLSFAVALASLGPQQASAKSGFVSDWQGLYPGSSSDDNVLAANGKSCQLCHAEPGGGDGWNQYGWAIWLGINDSGLAAGAAITAAQNLNSDGDPGGLTNLQEINADAQPGWTPGTNTVFFKDRTTSTRSAPGIANLDPTASNTSPVAGNDSYSTAEGTVLNVAAPGVLGNDTDADGDPLTAVLVGNVSSGTLSLAANGSFAYTPNAGFSGSDSFTYRANDGTADSNTATVSITVNPVADAPVATGDSYSTAEGTTLNVAAPGVLGNDTDADGDPLTAVLVDDVSNGKLSLAADGSFSYKPKARFSGSVSFTYRANDGTADSNLATVIISVVPSGPPVATGDSYSTTEGTTLNVAAPGVLGNDTDADGDPMTAALVSGVSNGSLTLNPNGSFSYSPSAGFSGADSFTYRANDGTASSNIATATITVTAVNDPPVADAGGPYTGLAGVAVTFDGSGSSDPDGNPIVSYAWNFGDGSTGAGANPTHTYAAAGTYTVTLTVTDPGSAVDTDTATATIRAAPVADAGGPYSAVENTPATLTGAASSDADGFIVSYSWSFGDGSSGAGVNPSHTYAAAGTYTVTLTVTDDDGLTDSDTAVANISSGAGAGIFAAECAACHGANGEGGIGPSLQVSTLSLTEIVNTVTNGRGAMPAFSGGTLTAAQIDAVSSYAKGLQSSTATTTTSTTLPPAASGSEVYAARCAACHGASGQGGIGPSLQVSNLSLSQIITTVVNGRGGMPAIGGTLTAAQIDAVSSYAKGLQSSTATTTTLPTTAGGPEVYAASCAACHGANGEGGIGASLVASTLSPADRVAIITNGRGGMPAFGATLTPEQIDVVAAHIGSFQRAGATTTTLGETVDAGALFAAKCAACHGVNREGGVGPALADTGLSTEEVVATITNGRGGMPAFGGDLTSEQIEALAVHLTTFGSADGDTEAITAAGGEGPDTAGQVVAALTGGGGLSLREWLAIAMVVSGLAFGLLLVMVSRRLPVP